MKKKYMDFVPAKSKPKKVAARKPAPKKATVATKKPKVAKKPVVKEKDKEKEIEIEGLFPKHSEGNRTEQKRIERD